MQTWDQRYRTEIAKKDKIIESLLISREPNPDDAPYRPAPIPNPGQKPWPGYPNPPKLAGILYPTRWPKNDPNAGTEPFDNEGNDLSVPVPNHPDWAGNSLKIADIKDSLQRENVGNTLRDVVLPPAMKEYGKTPSGGYKNPGALLSIMKKLV